MVITLLNLSSFAVYNVMTNGKIFGSLSPYIIEFASFPRLVKESINQVFSKIKYYQLPIDNSFSKINKLKNEIYLLNSYYKDSNSSIAINLINLKKEDTIHMWEYIDSNLLKAGFSINHPILSSDTSIIFKVEDGFIAKLDKHSNIIWKNNDLMFHHSIEKDNEGNIWVPSTILKGNDNNSKYIKNLNGKILSYRDDAITKINSQTGKILYRKSVSEILLENDLAGLIFGFWQKDPIHLNDIQPVLISNENWQTGDLFISCRNVHLVFQYRPETGKILWYKIGSWMNQHDIDIVDSTTLLIFNNNVNLTNYNLINKGGWKTLLKDENVSIVGELKNNIIVHYNYLNDSINDQGFRQLITRENINTITGGRSELISPELIFIEETNEGKIYIGNNKETLYRTQFISKDSLFSYYPGWSRIYTTLPFD